ncbi:MAG: RNA polymerase sigma factor [Actinomycetota bacterium]
MTIGARFGRVLEDARRGEPDGIEALYRDMAPSLLGYLRGQGAGEPEDLMSEVFEGVFRGLPRFHGEEAGFRSWVFTIAHRRLVDERRRRGRRREEAMDPADLAPHGPMGDAEGEAMGRLGSRWALDVLNKLTEGQRSVVLLRILADLPVAEVARVLGRSEGAVKNLLQRAVTRLADEIARERVT